MRRMAIAIAALIALALAPGCAADDAATAPAQVDEAACGIVVCVADQVDDRDVAGLVIDVEGGKADAADEVLARLLDVTADGELSAADVEALWEEAGGKKSDGELAVLRDAIADTVTDYAVAPEAAARAKDLARTANITDPAEVELLLSGLSWAGTEVPEAVREVVARARLNGAVAYDVTEVDEDGELVWTHYPSISPAEGNMAWAYTEVTPAALEADMSDVDVVYNAIVGTETATTPWGQEYQRARYEERVGGTGNVLAHYDEVYHHDLYARGAHGQKWASNLAILADGTFHCLPAPRRDVNQRVILTNPALARGQRILFNGHLSVRAGEVTDIELSGRLSKMAARGKVNFVDPLALLQAWGFTLAPGLEIRYGNTADGRPERRDGVITAPAPDPVVDPAPATP